MEGTEGAAVIYVVRHCQAEGQPPEAPLTAEGGRQAEALADFLADKGIDRIVSSPFLRARQSIAPLAGRLELPIHEDERLAERVLASGPLPDWLDWLARSFTEPDLALAGGESSRTAMARAAATVDDVLATGARAPVIVTHGNLLTLLLRRFDERFGFAEWQALTNPDLFVVSGKVERLWRG